MPSSNFINAINSRVAKKRIKIEILDQNRNVIKSISPTVISGDITFSSDSGSRRSCNITLDNSNGDFTPSESTIWLNSLFKVSTGYEINGVEEFESRGIFLLGEPEINSQFSEKIASLQLYDLNANLNGELKGTLDSPYIIDVGSSIEDVVRQVLIDAGETTLPIIFPTSEVTPFTIVKNPGDTYESIFQDLTNMLSWVYYFDRFGYFRFEPPTNVDTSPSVWTFSTDEIHYQGGTKRYAFSELRNNVVVYGDNIGATQIKATTSDTNPLSSTRIDLIGKRTLIVEDQNIYTLQLAQDRADFELQKSISVAESINLNSIPVDIIEGDMIVTIDDTSIGSENQRCLVKSCTFPLTNDAMSLSVWKARSLS